MVCDWEKEILKKIDNEECFTESELYDLINDFRVDEVCNYQGRWSKHLTTIIEIGWRYFGITWEKGLTEMQEDEINKQVPQEVEKIEKKVVVNEWVKKK